MREQRPPSPSSATGSSSKLVRVYCLLHQQEVKMIPLSSARTIAFAGLFSLSAFAQGTLADYQRGQGLQTKARGLAVNLPATPNWIGDSGHLWYSKTVKGGTEFVLVDAANQTRKPAFDHDKLAAAISTASGGKYTGLTLPFAPAPGGRGGGAGRGAI